MLDPTFGTGGTVVTSFQGSMGNTGEAAALQSDGKIVMVGQAGPFATANNGFALTRTNPDGSLDPTFGNGGRVLTQFSPTSGATAVVIQPDHKIVAAGSLGPSSSPEFGVARYNPDGSLDTTFGTGGTVMTAVLGFEDNPSGVTLQADGKIIVVGEAFTIPPSSGVNVDFALVRYNADGSLDTTFGSGGKVTTSLGSTGTGSAAAAVAVQADGRIVAVGNGQNGQDSAGHTAVVRYNADGSLDTTFAQSGKEVITVSASDEAKAVALQLDGKIVTAGRAGTGTTESDFALVRLNPDGSLDTSFNQTGMVITALNRQDTANSVAVQSDSKIVAAGMTTTGGLTEFAAVRYNVDGSLDAGFGQGGKVFTSFGQYDGAKSILLQKDSKIVAAGFATFTSSTGTDFAMARYNTDGSLDAGFGSGGKVTIDFPGPQPVEINAVALQADGKIVVAGNVAVADFNSVGLIAVARFNSDGSLDSTFGQGGWVTFDVAGFGGSAAAVALQSDGKIVIAGKASIDDSRAQFEVVLARLNPGGSLDNTFGNQGRVTLSFNAGNNQDSATSLVIQPDGKLVACGTTHADGGSFVARYNADGSVDTSFGSNGAVTLKVSGAGGMALQSDGKIVVLGMQLARLNPNGTLDSSFGTGGIAVSYMGPTVAGIVLSDGKIVAAGGPTAPDFVVGRFNSDGSADTSFGNGGFVATQFNGGTDAATSVVIQRNGKILVGGSSQHGSSTVFALARYNANGSLDTGFGTGGEITTDFGTIGPQINGLALQADGSLLAAGSRPQNFYLPIVGPSTVDMARYLLPPSQNERFVTQLYLDLLGRPVDQSGLSTFLNALDEGLVSRTQVVQIIETSQEYRTAVVEGMYTSFLGRSADSGGLQFWVSSLNAGATIEQVKSGILGSDEYFQRNGSTNSSFLQGVYHDVLSRPIDSAGAAAWGAELSSGTSRTAVAGQILASSEAERDLITSVYEHYLRRAPEDAGLSSWLSQLQQGLRDEDFVAAVAGSAEYFGRV